MFRCLFSGKHVVNIIDTVLSQHIAILRVCFSAHGEVIPQAVIEVCPLNGTDVLGRTARTLSYSTERTTCGFSE